MERPAAPQPIADTEAWEKRRPRMPLSAAPASGESNISRSRVSIGLREKSEARSQKSEETMNDEWQWDLFVIHRSTFNILDDF